MKKLMLHVTHVFFTTFLDPFFCHTVWCMSLFVAKYCEKYRCYKCLEFAQNRFKYSNFGYKLGLWNCHKIGLNLTLCVVQYGSSFTWLWAPIAVMFLQLPILTWCTVLNQKSSVLLLHWLQFCWVGGVGSPNWCTNNWLEEADSRNWSI